MQKTTEVKPSVYKVTVKSVSNCVKSPNSIDVIPFIVRKFKYADTHMDKNLERDAPNIN